MNLCETIAAGQQLEEREPFIRVREGEVNGGEKQRVRTHETKLRAG